MPDSKTIKSAPPGKNGESAVTPARIARVVINLSLDREFDYLIPPSMSDRIQIGSRVRVPFGKGKNDRVGYVVKLAADSECALEKLKSISGIEGEKAQIPDKLMELASWMANYYCCPREQAVRAMLPAVIRTGKVSKKRRLHVSLTTEKGLGELLPQLTKKAPKQAAIIQALIRQGGNCPMSRLLRDAAASTDAVHRLADKGVVLVESRDTARDPFGDDIILPTTSLSLTPEQEQAMNRVWQALEQPEKAETFLLYGVTGSGKTEIYLQAIEHCINTGKEAIVLVPEISLTPQTCERFRSRFGEKVSVLHSGLSDGERFDEWTKIHEGRSQIAVGARSALFAPFRRLGLIVVDEEHESTYKQEEAPRYHARDVAVVRGKKENAVVILGSATPSLESWRNCRNRKYTLLKLTQRIDNQVMPKVEIVDMREEAASRGQPQIFSRRLETLIRQRLEAGEQTILFLNRRGYATQMMCTQCGYVAMCDECSVSFTYHRSQQQLICHLCGEVLKAPLACPQCGDTNIRYTGLGTEKVEAAARALFKQVRIARMDSDTMTTRNAYKKTLDDFHRGRIQILLGTQMIAKGLHFPNVTLVGVIFADLGLHVPDFRAGEKTFQLLTQVSGRAGRGEIPGRVAVQSYTPFHPALQAARNHQLESFLEEELQARRELMYPPWTHMAIVHFRAAEESAVFQAAESFAGELRPVLDSQTEMAGPVPAPIARMRGKYRYQLVLRSNTIIQLGKQLRSLLMHFRTSRQVEIHVDVDPQSLL